MRSRRGLAFLALSGLLFQGCASYKRDTSDFVSSQGDYKSKIQERASQSKLYDIVPRHRSQLKFYDARWLTWGVFGNDDSGIFGEFEGNPYSENIGLGSASKWYLRNPAHNLSFYVVGSAWKEKHSNFVVIDLDSGGGSSFMKKNNGKVLGKGKFTFYFGFNDCKPFLSSRIGFFEFYTGWREKGNFSLFTLRGEHSEKKK